MFLTVPVIDYDNEWFQELIHDGKSNHKIALANDEGYKTTINTDEIERIEKYTLYHFEDWYGYGDENGKWHNQWGGDIIGDGLNHDVPVLVFRSGRRLPILETYEEFMAKLTEKNYAPKLQAKLIKKGAQK